VLNYIRDMVNIYNIIIDTNFIFSEFRGNLKKDILSPSIFELKDFVDNYELTKKIKIHLPQIVLEERIAQIMVKINETQKVIDERFRILTGFGISTNQSYKKKNYEKILNKELTDLIKENKFSVIKMPKITIDKVKKRALKNFPPFKKEGDRGFKDTIIWLSIIQYAKKYQDEAFIFITKNTTDFQSNEEFLNSEFKKECKNKLKFVSDLAELKQYLDSKLSLQLNLESINKKIEEELEKEDGKSYTDNIIKELNHGHYYYTGFAKKRIIEWFKFVSYDIEDIKKINDTAYEINLILIALAKLGPKEMSLYSTTDLGDATTTATASTFSISSTANVSSYGSTGSLYVFSGDELSIDEMPPTKFEVKLVYNETSNKLKIKEINSLPPVTIDTIQPQEPTLGSYKIS